VRRRDFITLLGGAAAAWPLAAGAQQPAMPVVGILNTRSPGDAADHVAAFRRGLSEIGFVDSRNITIEYRWAEGQYDRLPALAAGLVGLQVAVILAAGGSAPAQAAKAATANIPIVFISGGDPVTTGLVASINRPGGNVTGVSIVSSVLQAKRLELLHQLVPGAAVIGVLVNPNYPDVGLQQRELQEAAGTIGQQIRFVSAGTERASKPHFQPSSNTELTLSWSPTIRFSLVAAIKLSRWRRAMGYRRSTRRRILSRRAA
jgi:putative ABC transport system substrate-binding protein